MIVAHPNEGLVKDIESHHLRLHFEWPELAVKKFEGTEYLCYIFEDVVSSNLLYLIESG